MRKSVSLLLGLTLAVATATAQAHDRTTSASNYDLPASQPEYRDAISLAPTHILRGLKMGYERTVSPLVTVGGFFTAHGWLFDFRGVELAPICRIYFAGRAPVGFYFQPKVMIGFNTHRVDSYDYGSGSYGVYREHVQRFGHVGAGFSLGYQLDFGYQNRWLFDVSLGVRVVSDVPTERSYFGGFRSYADDGRTGENNDEWHLIDTGSPLDLHVGFGYRF